jgi:hypothetical protein
MHYSDGLFAIIDRELDDYAHHLRQRIFSLYRDLPWSVEQRQALQPLLRSELEYVVTQLLKTFDNVEGGRVSDGVLGYEIRVLLDDESDESVSDDAIPLRSDAQDYADAWRDYLLSRPIRKSESKSSSISAME